MKKGNIKELLQDHSFKQKRMEEKLKQNSLRIKNIFDGIVHALTLIVETRDPYTAGHQKRVAKLASAIAKEIGLLDEQVEAIRLAGLIHDVGKITVPSEILTKSSLLNENEFNIIKSHSEVGYDILKRIDFSWNVSEIVFQHHERLDGSGYPLGLYGEEILIEAKIIGVADVVEAMSSHRPYRPARGIGNTFSHLSENKEILYDSQVVEACLNLFYKKGFKLDKLG
ncbi:MAG: HD-GYP domain-containing protein [Candidatus Cloacimonadota bacterium]|nr:MAG: HD-GYP domain-containing protein [Candidatus Cloacimonadota bacterium]